MLRGLMGRSVWIVSAAALGLGFSASPKAVGDQVKLKDGRVFTGNILVENEQGVEIDTVVATIRAQLTFSADQVASTAKSTLAPDFFDLPRGEVSRSSPEKFAKHSDLYVEVPVVGVIGSDVVAEGFRKALAYAERNGIDHVVFRVDSDGGSLDETQSIVRVMQRYDGKIQMHALVSRCLGDALAVPMLCDTVTFVPGVVIGGSEEPLSDDSELEQTLRTDLARKASIAASAKGKPADLIRASIDPSERIALWEDEDGEPTVGRLLPQGILAERVIAEIGPDELLVLDTPMLTRLGAPLIDTDVAGLGETLGLDEWVAESDYGIETMARAAEAHKARQERKDAKDSRAIARNIERREAADATLKQGIRQAKEWDPSGASYATYQTGGRDRRWNSSGDSRDTNRLTKQSRNEWAQRSEAAMGYLSQAAKAARSLKKLDEQAIKLGLEPTYGPGELDMIIQDLTVKYKFLSANRNKKSK